MEIINPVITYPPTIGDSYGNGWKQLWKFFLELFLIGIITFLISFPMTLPSVFGRMNFNFSGNMDMNSFEELDRFTHIFYPYMLYVIAYSVLLVNPLKYGVQFAYLKAARGEKVEVRDMFSFTGNYINTVFASLLTGFIIGLGFVMLIIPGIIFACKLAFVPYLVIDKKMDAIGALKASWEMTDGHAIDIFVMGILTVPIALIGLILLFVGIIPAIMWIRMSFASLYHGVDILKSPKI